MRKPGTLLRGSVTPEAEFLVEKPGTKTGLPPGFFTFSCRLLLPQLNIVFLVVLSCFLPGFFCLSHFPPVLKRGLWSHFHLILQKVFTISVSPVRTRKPFPLNRKRLPLSSGSKIPPLECHTQRYNRCTLM